MSKRSESEPESITRRDENSLSKKGAPAASEFENIDLDQENDFDPEESIFELDPFVLPGETMTQEITPIGFESPLTDSDISKLESKTRPSTTSKDEDQEDTIPPGEAKDEWLERQTGIPKKTAEKPGSQPRLSYASTEVPLTPEERRMLFEYEQRKKSVKKESSGDRRVGSVIADKYGIVELIGKGNMATVYKVKSFSEGKIYAAKTTRSNATAEDLERFNREILTHSKLSHPNIVEFIETLRLSDGTKFLIMENVKGISLHDVLEIHGPVKQAENIWNILSQICDALDHAHERGVIHRDLKSGNVILAKKANERMEVKILDFGIAQIDDLNALKITNPGRSVGSPLYMSPEQCQGDELTRASDIYALGVLAYELVTGSVPYKFDTVYEIMKSHCDPDIKPASLQPKLPEVPYIDQLERIIFKALETEPIMRFESAIEFRTVLERWIERVREEKKRIRALHQ